VEQMVEEGADIIDIGGESTRPGSTTISPEEELKRIIPIIDAVSNKLGDKVLLSVDTYKSSVAKEALQAGVKMINSLGGFTFGKTLEHNLEIIKRLHEFKKLDLPLLIGASRKSHLGKLLQQRLGLPQMPGASERLEASLAETAVAVLKGVSIVRTHDVLPTVK